MSFKSKFINLPQSGFSHLVIPITVVVVIVILGGYTYERSSSAAAVYDNIHSGVTGKCLDDYYDRSVDGTKVDSYACNTGTSQEWTLRKEINNTYLVVNENGSCLDDYIAKTANGSPIAMYKCNPTDGAQLWFTTGNTLKNPRAGKCIEDTKGSTVNGTQLTLYPCNGDNDQKWTVEAAASTTPATLGIQNVGPTAISATSEKVTWTTTKAATGEFQYGKTTAYTVTDKNATASTTHNFTISGLAAGTVYDYKVTSTASGKTVTATGKFTTETASSGGTNGGGSGGGGGATTFGSCATTLAHGGSTSTSLDGGKYNMNLDEWDSSNAFSICSDSNVGFKITSNSINQSGGAPGAYPNIYYGDGGGQSTTGSGLPIEVSKIVGGGIVTTDYNTTTTGTSGGDKWDDAYDIWFNATADSTSASNKLGDLEMMVWLNHNGGASPAGSEIRENVNIGGITYNIWDNTGTVSYVVANSVESVTNLDIGLLAADALKYKYGEDGGMSDSSTNEWYLLDVQAGFEVWDSVNGLTANSFSVTVK
jgi:hypothetical protein